MLFSCLYAVRRDLKYQKRLLRIVGDFRNRLEEYRGLNIEIRHKGYNDKYLISQQVDGKKKREYATKEKLPIVGNVVSLRFCDAIIRRLRNNVKLLEKLDYGYKSIELDDVLSLLPATYRISCSGVKGIYGLNEALKWKTEAEARRAQKPNTYKPQSVHFARDGTVVKSKSEKELYNMLLDKGYIFVYELPLTLASGLTIYPDFTIYVDRDRVLYIEHDGAFKDSLKRTRTFEKMEKFYMNGYAFGRDVIFTFDDPDGTFDLERAEQQIQAAMVA